MFGHSREKRESRAGHSSSVALDSRFLSCQEILQTGQFVVPAKAGTQEPATEIPGYPLSRERRIYDPRAPDFEIG
jgi:hypothetical protein